MCKRSIKTLTDVSIAVIAGGEISGDNQLLSSSVDMGALISSIKSSSSGIENKIRIGPCIPASSQVGEISNFTSD